ncbi:MAG: Methyltransferase type 11 [Candidatus Yanofskybacteria bacterium GW2011_GWF1_44_227]|nr:MAG: Methyltransferase type 11 [Candidatus Yanofskybacteria bacterium GW2011_GWF1_44_227]
MFELSLFSLLPFEDGKFDIILCTEVLEHLHSPHVAISEMKRVLKVGGKLILTTRFIFPIHDAPGDYFRYTKYGLRYLFKDWNVISLVEEVGTKDAFAVLLQRIGFQTDLLGGMATKIMVFALARLINAMPSLIRDEFGDIRKQSRENNILTSGYYLVANKK